MSDIAKDALSIRDQRMIVSMYHLRDMQAVAEAFSISKSAVNKRFEKIHANIGPLFQFGRKTVTVLAHTRDIVAELEAALEHIDAALALGAGNSPFKRRTTVNVAVVDQLEAPLVQGIASLLDPDQFQVQFHHAASYILQDRMQNTYEMSKLLENGDIDMLVCYEFDNRSIKTQYSQVPKFKGMQSRELAKDRLVAMLHPSEKVSEPMTGEEFDRYRRVMQNASYANHGADIPWLVTHLATASQLISDDPQLICTPATIIADYYAKAYQLKVAELPEEHQMTVSIRLVWSRATDHNEACTAVRSSIIRYFTSLA